MRQGAYAVMALFASACMDEARVDHALTDVETSSDDAVDPSEGEVRIVGGEAPDTPEHTAVVALHELTSDGTAVYLRPFCSGTLISRSVVVTAGHCVEDLVSGGVLSPRRVAVYVGNDSSKDLVLHLYRVGEIERVDTYDPYWVRNDLSLLRLDRDVSEQVMPVEPLDTADALQSTDVKRWMNVAGFGVDDVGTTGRKLQVDVRLKGFGCGHRKCPESGDSETQFWYNLRDGGACFGDSGGPVFVYDEGGTARLAGVTSYGDVDCARYVVSTRVDAFEPFIDAFLNPVEDPDDGEEPREWCGDGVCGVGESCDGRYETISCSQDCDGVTTGRRRYRFCEVEGVCEGKGC